LFGCSVEDHINEEGCGEIRICLVRLGKYYQNMLCFDKEKSSAGGVVITFLGVDGNIDLQK